MENTIEKIDEYTLKVTSIEIKTNGDKVTITTEKEYTLTDIKNELEQVNLALASWQELKTQRNEDIESNIVIQEKKKANLLSILAKAKDYGIIERPI